LAKIEAFERKGIYFPILMGGTHT